MNKKRAADILHQLPNNSYIPQEYRKLWLPSISPGIVLALLMGFTHRKEAGKWIYSNARDAAKCLTLKVVMFITTVTKTFGAYLVTSTKELAKTSSDSSRFERK